LLSFFTSPRKEKKKRKASCRTLFVLLPPASEAQEEKRPTPPPTLHGTLYYLTLPERRIRKGKGGEKGFQQQPSYLPPFTFPKKKKERGGKDHLHRTHSYLPLSTSSLHSMGRAGEINSPYLTWEKKGHFSSFFYGLVCPPSLFRGTFPEKKRRGRTPRTHDHHSAGSFVGGGAASKEKEGEGKKREKTLSPPTAAPMIPSTPTSRSCSSRLEGRKEKTDDHSYILHHFLPNAERIGKKKERRKSPGSSSPSTLSYSSTVREKRKRSYLLLTGLPSCCWAKRDMEEREITLPKRGLHSRRSSALRAGSGGGKEKKGVFAVAL